MMVHNIDAPLKPIKEEDEAPRRLSSIRQSSGHSSSGIANAFDAVDRHRIFATVILEVQALLEPHFQTFKLSNGYKAWAETLVDVGGGDRPPGIGVEEKILPTELM